MPPGFLSTMFHLQWRFLPDIGAAQLHMSAGDSGMIDRYA
jgi:hypothetical protein